MGGKLKLGKGTVEGAMLLVLFFVEGQDRPAGRSTPTAASFSAAGFFKGSSIGIVQPWWRTATKAAQRKGNTVTAALHPTPLTRSPGFRAGVEAIHF